MSNAMQRLIQFIEYKNDTKYKFCKKTGLSNGYLDKNRNIGSDKCEIISEVYPDLNLTWLITGKGEMINEMRGEDINILHHPRLPDKIIDNQTIKLYELDAAANLNTLNLEASKEFAENIQVPNAPKCDGATYIKGDSMYPLLKSGDIVAFKQVHNIDYILYGEMYLVSYTIDGDDYLVVKFVCKSEKEGHLKLVSQNEHHAPRDIPVSSIRYLGIVKISIRFNSSI